MANLRARGAREGSSLGHARAGHRKAPVLRSSKGSMAAESVGRLMPWSISCMVIVADLSPMTASRNGKIQDQTRPALRIQFGSSHFGSRHCHRGS
eukprot:5170313-Lingulodinium_polyedra.AAC.1